MKTQNPSRLFVSLFPKSPYNTCLKHVMKTKRLPLHFILAFGFGFLVIYCLYAGLPYDFNADMLRDEKVTSTVTYFRLFSLLTNPTTPIGDIAGNLVRGVAKVF